METTTELPPRPPARTPFWRLLPALQTQESWQTLVAHPRRVELAIIAISILSLPFTIIASVKYHYVMLGGLLSAFFTILASIISLWLYTRNRLSCTMTLIRSVIFCAGWFITTASARWIYYEDTDDNDYIVYSSDWSTLVRSILYAALCIVFFMYLVLSAVAVHRERNRRYPQNSRMQAAAAAGAPPLQGTNPYGPSPYGYPLAGYPPQGEPPQPTTGQYQQPPPGPPPGRHA